MTVSKPLTDVEKQKLEQRVCALLLEGGASVYSGTSTKPRDWLSNSAPEQGWTAKHTHTPQRMTRDTIRQLQECLNALGQGSGEPDGKMGPITGGAISRFIEENISKHPELESARLNASAQRGLAQHQAKHGTPPEPTAETKVAAPAPAITPTPTITPTLEVSPAKAPRISPPMISSALRAQLASVIPSYKPAPETAAEPVLTQEQTPIDNTRTRIVLDLGHNTPNSRGKRDPGATATLPNGKEVTEASINEAVGNKLKAMLTARGYEVVFSHRDTAHKLQPGDCTPFFQRTHTAPDAPAFISLHCDARPKGDHGTKVHVHHSERHDGKESLSERFADMLHSLGGNKQKRDTNSYNNFTVLSPGMHKQERSLRALVEMGALEGDDLKRLTSNAGQMEIAKQIADALEQVYPSKHKPAQISQELLANINIDRVANTSTTLHKAPPSAGAAFSKEMADKGR